MMVAAVVLLAISACLAWFAAGIMYERRHAQALIRERELVAEAYLVGLRNIQQELIRQVQTHGGAPWLN